MPSRKKQKPSYNVPEDLNAAPQTGWVYRSAEKESSPTAAAPVEDAGVAKAVERERRREETKEKSRSSNSMTTDIIELTAKTITSGIATMGNAMLLSARVVSAPFVMGMRFMGFKSR